MKNFSKTQIAKSVAALCTTGLMMASQAAFAAGAGATGADSSNAGASPAGTSASRTGGMETNTTGNASRSGEMGNTGNDNAFSDATQNTGTADFSSIDRDGDERLGWSEINETHDQELSDAGWDQEQVFEDYDENEDNYLDEDEYENFTAGLNEEQDQSVSAINR